jgi:hypothetical protein
MECEFFQYPDSNPPKLQACLSVSTAIADEVRKCEALRSGAAEP